MFDTNEIQVPEELVKWKELTKECAVKAKEFYKQEREQLDNQKPKLEECIADIQDNITSATNELCNSGFHFTETIRILPTMKYGNAPLKILFPGDDYIELECCIFCKKILSAKKIKLCYGDDKNANVTLNGKIKYTFIELAENKYPDAIEYTISAPNLSRLLATAKCYMNLDIKENFKITPLNCGKLCEITQSLFNEEAIFDLYHVYNSHHINISHLIAPLSYLIKLKEEFDKLTRDEFYKHKELCHLFGHDISAHLNTGHYHKCACCQKTLSAHTCLSNWENAPYRGLVFPRPELIEPLSEEQKAARRKQFYEGY